MSSEVHSLLANEGDDDEDVPFTDPSPKKRRVDITPDTPKEGNIFTRNKITSLLLIVGIVTVLIVSAVVVFFIVRNADKDAESTDTSQLVIKPQNDDRSYRTLVLPNQLRVLLISDPQATEAAAAMDINAGSFNDPIEVDGLAHFCEHMLFLGTKKYPDKSEYSNYLSTNGGYDNAYTSTQNTNYYFSVNTDSLEGALDRFAQFFIAPLFTANSTYGEMNAVNSEYDKDLNDPGWKQWQLLKNVSNPQHPFSRFNIGSIGTLNRTDIRDQLIKYYEGSYSANQMQLAVLGKEPISTLEDWAKSKFSDVPNRNITALTFSTTSFPSDYTGKIVYFVPGQPAHGLNIFWQVPKLQDKYRNHVSSLISRYIGDEGHGSILDYLKKQQWAYSVSAYTEVDTDSYSLYAVDIALTDEGLVHVKSVVASVFQYIRILSAVTNTQWQSMWNENIKLNYILFNTKDKENPHSYVSDLASKMRVVKDPADFLSPPSRGVFDSQLIRNTLNALTPSNSLVFIGSPNLEEDARNSTRPLDFPWPHLNEIEPWFSTSFVKIDTPNDVINVWKTDDKNVKLSLPTKNKFIPEDLEILSLDEDYSDLPTQNSSEEGLSVWWLQDNQFRVPKIDLVCSLETPMSYDTSRNFALNNLFLNYISQVIANDLYPATLAGYTESLSFTASGLVVKVSGYSDEEVMKQYLTLLLQEISNATDDVDEDVYQVTLHALISYYEGYSYNQLPYRYIRSYIQPVILQEPYWKHSAILSELQTITSSEMKQHAKNVLMSFNTNCLVHGNVLESKAISYASQVRQMLSQPNTTAEDPFCASQIVMISQGVSSVAIRPLNPLDKNSLVNVIYQIGPACQVNQTYCSGATLRDSAMAGLLQLIMKDLCFAYLRTVKQLGYVATCYSSTRSNVITFELLVQSGTYGPDHILSVMDEFLVNFRDNQLAEITQENKFKNIRDSYIDVLNQKKVTLSDKTTSLWNEISVKLYQFDINSQLANIVNSITGDQLRNFYTVNIMQSSTQRKMTIAIFGHPMTPHHINGTTTVDYDNIEEFKNDASYFAAPNC